MKTDQEDRVNKTPEYLKRFVSQPDMVSGIRKHCNSRCERYTPTLYCLVHKMNFHAYDVVGFQRHAAMEKSNPKSLPQYHGF